MTEHKGACCSSPAAICYWFVVSLIAWGILSFVGSYWHPLQAASLMLGAGFLALRVQVDVLEESGR